jgi:hypothetical protein
MYRVTQNIAAAGEHEFLFPNASPNRWLQRLSFRENVSTVSKLEIFRGETRLFEGTREDVEFAMQRHSEGKRAVIAGYFVFEPTMMGFGNHGALNTGQKDSLKFKLTVSHAGAMEVIVEGYEQVKLIETPAAQA